MEPSWKKVAIVKVCAAQGPWIVGRTYIPGSRLLRFTAVNKDEQNNTVSISWSPAAGICCGPDGLVSLTTKGNILTTGALYGALIGKMGGSSADLLDGASTLVPYPNRHIFAIGSHCVIALGPTEGGPLYFTMNDSPDAFANHSQNIHVLIEECAT